MPNTLPESLELTESTQIILDEYLELTRAQIDAANNNRKHYVKLARTYGMTFRAIGVKLGYSEAHIRKIAASE